MKNMDFYAFLPSNASPNVYPDNKTSQFKIEFSKRLDLHGKWSVALIEIHYPNTISQVVEGENYVFIRSDTGEQATYVKPGYYTTKVDFLNALQEAIATFDVHGTQFVEETPENRIKLKCFGGTKFTKYKFSYRLALQLGLSGEGPHLAQPEKPLLGEKPIDISLGTPPQMYVYMDILADQIVGHTRAPILRAVPLNTQSNFGTMSIFHCEHPLYFELKTRSFDTLEVNIRDHAGRFVPFDHGTLTLLVHFKQIS